MTQNQIKEEELVGTIIKNAVTKIKIAIKSMNNKKYIDVREFKSFNNQSYPTSKGIFIAKEQISEVLNILEIAEAKL